MPDLLDFFNARQQQALDLTCELVEFESPTHNKPLVDKLGNHLHIILENMGAEITLHPRQMVGDIRVARWNRGASGKPIMILSHIDTVWPEGTLRDDMPIRHEDGRIYGPGILDMKSGIVAAVEAIKGLQARDEFPDRPIWFVLTSDEETGSVYSKDLIHELAPEAGLVLVTELAGENEAVKTWRKGVARYWVKSKGVASHSGNAPEAGVNAIIDMAHQALKVDKLNNLPEGTSVAVTQAKGGITLNVIPPEAEFYIDVRFLKQTEYERVDEQIRALRPVILGADLEVKGYLDRPPMERTPLAIQTFQQARQIAEQLGMQISETGSGGGSDGNFTAALGIPTLDGMGPQGEGIHARHEHIYTRSLPRRVALIAAILRDWQMTD